MALKHVQMELFEFPAEAPAAVPEPEIIEPDTDGITADDFERISVRLPKQVKAEIGITLAQGISGSWYYGRSIRYADEGNGYAAWPKFSERYASNYLAVQAAKAEILLWLKKKGMSSAHLRLVDKELGDVCRCMNPEEYNRDQICGEWRDCGYQEQCFAQDDGRDGDPVCFKDQELNKGKKAVSKTLSELCFECKSAHAGCNKCCASCQDRCNAGQRCRWPDPDPKTDVRLSR